jgi:hypothetical protein
VGGSQLQARLLVNIGEGANRLSQIDQRICHSLTDGTPARSPVVGRQDVELGQGSWEILRTTGVLKSNTDRIGSAQDCDGLKSSFSLARVIHTILQTSFQPVESLVPFQLVVGQVRCREELIVDLHRFDDVIESAHARHEILSRVADSNKRCGVRCVSQVQQTMILPKSKTPGRMEKIQRFG